MSIPFEAYQGEAPYIFVSYAHKDTDVVYYEIKRLHEAGYKIWYDEGIQPTKEWPEEIAVAINNCIIFLVFISPQSVESKNVRNEINYALNKNKKFIAVYAEETTLYPGLELQMGSIQAIMKFQMSDDHYYRKLIKTLNPSIKCEFEISEKIDRFEDIEEIISFSDIPDKEEESRKIAENLIYQGNEAFTSEDMFLGIERYKRGIDKFIEINDIEESLTLLKFISNKCISSDYLVLAEEFAEELLKLAMEHDKRYYRGEAYYLLGLLLLKKGDNHSILESLKIIEKASVDFELEGDFAGSGMCFNKIGIVYQVELNQIDSACLFYLSAIKDYNKAMLKFHPLRTSAWAKPEALISRIVDLKELIKELVPKISDKQIKSKINSDLRKINYNF